MRWEREETRGTVWWFSSFLCRRRGETRCDAIVFSVRQTFGGVLSGSMGFVDLNRRLCRYRRRRTTCLTLTRLMALDGCSVVGFANIHCISVQRLDQSLWSHPMTRFLDREERDKLVDLNCLWRHKLCNLSSPNKSNRPRKKTRRTFPCFHRTDLLSEQTNSYMFTSTGKWNAFHPMRTHCLSIVNSFQRQRFGVDD